LLLDRIAQIFIFAARWAEKERWRKWLDLAFVLRGQDTGYAAQLECCGEPKKKENAQSMDLRNKIVHGLEQLRADYQNFAIEECNIQKRLYSCVLFGKDGKLIASTNALTFDENPNVQENLKNGKTEDKVTWE
jgi:hypothetical protein